MTRIVGIVNITRDSFSDGGRYLEPGAALGHAETLLQCGADIIELGARSSHPDSADVTPDEEIARLTPVVGDLVARGALISIDTTSAAVMRVMAQRGAGLLNDINGFRDPEALAAAAGCSAQLVVMHATSAGQRATRNAATARPILDLISAFFEERIATLTAAGIARERLILDPGMGYFLGADPATSLEALAALDRLRGFGLPLLVSVSRKSFLGATLGSPVAPRAVAERGAATLAAELWAMEQGATFIRTHDVRGLHDGIRIWQALRAARERAGSRGAPNPLP